MSKFEDLVNDFNGMTPEEKLYWMERIIQSFNLREKLDLSKSLRDLISKAVTAPPAAPPTSGPSDQIGVREPKDPKTPLLGSGATRRLDEDSSGRL